MGNAFRAGPNNEAPHGRDMTDEDRKYERCHKTIACWLRSDALAYVMLIVWVRLYSNADNAAE